MCKSNTFFSFTNYFYEKNLLAQEFVLKQKQIDDGDGDIGIGQVEDGSEKVVVAVHQEVQEPRYTVPLEEREIEHVDDLAHHESGVVSAEMCDRIGRRLREEQPVESAVDDIAQGTGHNQRQPTMTPLGVSLRLLMRWCISQPMTPTITIRKIPSRSFPQSNPPLVSMCIPKAAPLFSMKRNWNQSGKTTIDSSRCMWVLTQILSA